MMGGAAATETELSFAKTPLVLLGQAPDATPLVTGNSAAGKWGSWMQVALLMSCAVLPYLQEPYDDNKMYVDDKTYGSNEVNYNNKLYIDDFQYDGNYELMKHVIFC